MGPAVTLLNANNALHAIHRWQTSGAFPTAHRRLAPLEFPLAVLPYDFRSGAPIRRREVGSCVRRARYSTAASQTQSHLCIGGRFHPLPAVPRTLLCRCLRPFECCLLPLPLAYGHVMENVMC